MALGYELKGWLSDAKARLVLALFAFVLGFGLSAARIGHGGPDFYVFWTAARHWQAPYDPSIIASLERQIHLTGVWPFTYPPTFLVFVFPFALLPLSLAYPLWAGLSVALFVYAASHLVRPIPATVLLLLAPPVFFSAALGQTSLLIGAAAIGALTLADRRPAVAGVLLGLAATIKPQALALAPLVFFGRWRLLGSMAATGFAVVMVSLTFGWQRWLEWPHALTAFAALTAATERVNPSALLPGLGWAALTGAFGVYLAIASRNLLGLIGGALCVTPYAHAYDLAPLTPLAATWLIGFRQFGWPRTIAAGALLAGAAATPWAVLAVLALAALGEAGWRPLATTAPAPASGPAGA
jgi:multidrug transporter EmrE-like cation transporter